MGNGVCHHTGTTGKGDSTAVAADDSSGYTNRQSAEVSVRAGGEHDITGSVEDVISFADGLNDVCDHRDGNCAAKGGPAG